MSLSDGVEAQHAVSGDLLRVLTAVRVRPFSASEAKSGTQKLIVSLWIPRKWAKALSVIVGCLQTDMSRV